MQGNEKARRQVSRRDLLKLGGKGVAIAAAGVLLPSAGAEALRRFSGRSAQAVSGIGNAGPTQALHPAVGSFYRRLGASDGFISLPGRDPLFIMGFRDVPLGDSVDALDVFKGQAQTPAPILWVDQDASAYVTVTNLGFVTRPDLDDSHTFHWHGFRNQTSAFDGVPEMSIAVPVARDFNYFFQVRDEGTYMYHCHFEDVEHVQMGMTGVIFVRPRQNLGTPLVPAGNYAYNDRDGSTAYDREYALLLSEIWSAPHDNLASIQESKWTDYDPDYWIMNGRCYPDTLKPNLGEPGADPVLVSQPVSSLVQVNEGDRVLLRLVNLGYQQHSMQLSGIGMRVIGEDATYLGRLANGRGDISYAARAISIGPGESRDAIFVAPPHSGAAGPDTYVFRNRNLDRTTNPGSAGMGGMATEIRVYPAGAVPAQTHPNQTFAV